MAPSNQHSKMTRRLLLHSLAVLLAAHANATPSKCVLPAGWRGDWFHSGVPMPVTVNKTTITFKGKCLESDRDRYLVFDLNFHCYRCLVIHQKHQNILQYKETYCDHLRSLEVKCSQLTGDAVLHSMVRYDAEPVVCPFPHIYTFTYNRGQAECDYPLSTVDSCTEDSRMVFRYQACPDIQGTESTTEMMRCLAVWKEGSNHYLVGKSDHPLATSDEDRYRCFVYDAWDNGTNSGFKVAQSGDATCTGLFSVYGGSKTLTLTKVHPTVKKCRFPTWLSGSIWHSLNGTTALYVTHRNSTMRLTSHSEPRIGTVTYACYQAYDDPPEYKTYVTRVIHGCTNGYQCVRIYSRDTQIVELNIGNVTPVASAACQRHYFDPASKDLTTFVSTNAETQECPLLGRYQVLNNNENGDGEENANVAASTSLASSNGGSGRSGGGAGGGGGGGGSSVITNLDLGDLKARSCESSYRLLSIGCESIHMDTLVLQASCDSKVFSCHGWWKDGGHHYLVVTPTSRSSKGVRRLCLVVNHGSNFLTISSSTQSCERDIVPGVHGHIAFNSTNLGGCHYNPFTDVSSASRRGSALSLVVGVMTSLLMLMSRGLVLLR